ncbi:hypothetical protein BCR33DRAFT_764320, partial [Rhizoclosmatium globosum]
MVNPTVFSDHDVLSLGYVVAVLLILSVCLMFFLFWFASFEVIRLHSRLTWQLVLTPFNKILTVMNLSILLIFLSETVSLFWFSSAEIDDLWIRFVRPFQTLCFALFSQSYLYYSWQRGDKSVESMMPERLIVFKCYIRFSILTSIASVVSQIVRSIMFTVSSTYYLVFGLSVLVLTQTILFDGIVLLVFRMHTIETKMNDADSVDAHFGIVLHYGLLALLSLTFTLTSTILSYVVNGTKSFIVLRIFTYILLFLTYVSLVMLKVALFWDKVRKEEEENSKLQQVIGKEEIERRKQRSLDAHSRSGSIDSNIYLSALFPSRESLDNLSNFSRHKRESTNSGFSADKTSEKSELRKYSMDLSRDSFDRPESTKLQKGPGSLMRYASIESLRDSVSSMSTPKKKPLHRHKSVQSSPRKSALQIDDEDEYGCNANELGSKSKSLLELYSNHDKQDAISDIDLTNIRDTTASEPKCPPKSTTQENSPYQSLDRQSPKRSNSLDSNNPRQFDRDSRTNISIDRFRGSTDTLSKLTTTKPLRPSNLREFSSPDVATESPDDTDENVDDSENESKWSIACTYRGSES